MQMESDLANVRIVQGCIHLIQNEEGSRAEAVRKVSEILDTITHYSQKLFFSPPRSFTFLDSTVCHDGKIQT